MPRTNPYKACEDFHRTMAQSEAGLSRRRFVGLGLGAGLTLYGARSLPLARVFDSAEAAAAATPEARILVSVFLPGGLDLLDALVPLNQYGPYRDYRGAHAQADVTTPKLGSTGLGIHPSLTQGTAEGIKGLFDRGKLGFLPGIDYANPNLSHFHSRNFWETGLITQRKTSGWLGRWLDLNGGMDNPFQGVTSGYGLSPLLRSAGAPVCSLHGVGSSQLDMHGVDAATVERAMTAWTDLAHPRAKDAAQMAATRTAARFAQDVAVKLRAYKDAAPVEQTEGGLAIPGLSQGPSGYPPNSGFGDRLRQLAFLLAQPLGIRVATVDADGDFDTHHNQSPVLQNELRDISEALSAFQADLEARGLGDRVLTFVWSEFGRRPKGNNSAGTDHGAAGIAWVQGMHARGGVLTEYPDLRSLDEKQNLKVTVDFRQIYASLIEQWLGTDAAAVITDAGAFARVQVTR